MNNIAIFEGERASNYDQFITNWMPHYPFLLAHLPHILFDNMPKKEEPILVIGCGTGNEIHALLKHNSTGQIWGIDPSPEMIAQAHTKLANHSNVFLREAYISDLSKTTIFHAATLILVLHFIPDDGAKLDLLKNIAQRLAPGAPLIISDIFGTNSSLKANLKVLKSMVSQKLPPEVIEERIQQLPERIEYIPEERLVELLQLSGFEKPTRFFQTTIYGTWLTRKI